MNNGLFTPAGGSNDPRNDAIVLPLSASSQPTPFADPQAAQVDAINAQVQQQQQQKQYTGNPILDKYIHMFIGQ